jgi:predicted O-methyltransferase YrrM
VVREIFDDSKHYNAFDDIAFIRAQLESNQELIQYHDYGAGPHAKGSQGTREISVAQLARSSASDAEQGTQLFRLVHHVQPTTLLELGSSLGIGSAYLCTPNRAAKFVGIEGNPQSAIIAQKHLEMLGCGNAEVWSGTFSTHLPKAINTLQSIDFVYIDGDHRYVPTLNYFETILPACSPNAVIVFDDIYWTQDMQRAWKTIINRPEVTASLDLWSVGIIWLNPAFQQKMHLKVLKPALKPWQKYF